MDHIISFILFVWLAVIVCGLVMALLPALAFIAGFAGMILLVAFIGRLISSWLFF